MILGVSVFIMNDNGELLSVSRKDNPNDIGLPGGKVEPGETPLEAVRRELFEETGYNIIDPRNIQLIYHAESDGKLDVTYQVPYSGIKKIAESKEAGVVSWNQPEALVNGKTFGEYNRSLFKTIGLHYGSDDDFYRRVGLKRKE